MMKHQQAAAAIVQKDPNVAAFFSSCGGFRNSNAGQISIRLKPRNERELSADEVIAELRPKLAQITGLRAYLQNPPPISLGGRASRALYQYTLQSPDTSVLYPAAQTLLEKVRKLPGFVDVSTDLQITNPQITVDIDRDRAASYGLTANQIEDALYTAYGSRQVSQIYTPTNEYQVILEVDPKYQHSPSELALLYVRAASGELVPISAFAKLAQNVGPLTVNHSGQMPSVTISFNLKPGYSLGEAVTAIDAVGKQNLPPTVVTSYQGQAQAFQSSMQGLGVLLIMAIAVIYMVLGILYESFIHPITILSALPFAGFGALLTLLIFKVDLSIYAFVGVIMLVGLVKKNGIMMVDFAVEAQKAGLTAEQAIFDACVVRFRPIMMTTMAALMGTLPIALGLGAGAESRRPLGLAVVGGLLFSQTLTLFVTPVFYLYMDKLRTKPQAEEVESSLREMDLEPEEAAASM
jgi:hydrophobic/amphiphilic exporter-1 (mainly G- bacteria), HAE1 family